MGTELFLNIGITMICLIALGMYFNRREKKLQTIATSKFKEIQDIYLHQLAKRKVKERQEIEKLKSIVDGLEQKHKKILTVKNFQQEKAIDNSEAEKIIKEAQEKAEKIKEEAQEKAKRFLEEQKVEVQGRMIDLVIGVTKKVLGKSLLYNDHKEMIEKAVMEMEGEELND